MMLAPAQTLVPTCSPHKAPAAPRNINPPPPTKQETISFCQHIPIGPPRSLFQASPKRASPRLIPAPEWFWISTPPRRFRHLTQYLRTPGWGSGLQQETRAVELCVFC